VRTAAGELPIESVRVGDRVLTQDTATGALSFQPVLSIHHNPPNATLRIELEGGESVVATGIHRFWKAGRGWIMARALAAGDVLRPLDGPARVAGVAAERAQPVFNLEVARGQSFFVGRRGVLAHDNSVIQP